MCDVIDVPIGVSPTGKKSIPLAFKIEFVRQWDECVERGAKVRLMREHGLSSGTVGRWLRARDRGEWTASMVAAAERPKRRVDSRDRAELARLRRENEVLKQKVAQAEAAQDILGKAFELLEGINKSSTTSPQVQIPPSLMSAEEYARWLKGHRVS
jgi:hypothetical protein